MRFLSICFFLVATLALATHGLKFFGSDGNEELEDEAIFDLIDKMSDGQEEHVLAKEIGKLIDFSKTRSSLGCSLCSGLVGVVKLLAKLGRTKALSQLAVIICRLIDYADRDVCSELVDVYDDSVYGVLKYTALKNRELCSLFLDCGPITNPAFDWNITLPDVPKPPVQTHEMPASGSKSFKVLHLADIHIDFEYAAGSVADCAQPLCCRKTSTVSGNSQPRPDQLSGQWGDYRNCDLPFWTYENMLRHIADNEEFDYIYWTGDIPPHEMWGQTKQEQISAIRWITAQFQKYFPKKKVFTSVGNHESEPSNLFPMPNVPGESMKWLYSELAENWIQTGLPNSLRADITKGAFYTVEVAPGFRVIGLNTNYCHFYNFWLFINTTDPLNQLDWLAKTLQESENKGEKVHILGHYPPSSCLKSWSENYYRIVNRYESTITGMFYGHTHNDEFQIFYDLQDSTRPTEVAYITGSVTTWPTINPGYRIFTVNEAESGSPWEILEVRNVFVNLTEANASNKPQWVDEYSATSSFGMTSLFPEDWDSLINRMLADIDGELVDKLIAYWTKSAVLDDECDSECRREFVCKFKQARSATQVPC